MRIANDHFLAIRAALAFYTYQKRVRGEMREITAMVPTRDVMQCFIDHCYPAIQRSTEIRALLWKQDPTDPFGYSWVDRKAGVLHFVPSKTEDSSGEVVDWPPPPEIDAVLKRAQALMPQLVQRYVIHDEHGQLKTDGALRDAWEGAKKRAGLDHMSYTIKDNRAKAMTDAKKLGYDIDALQAAGAHAAREMTESISSRGKCRCRPCGWRSRRPSQRPRTVRRVQNLRHS